jgi:hypothetical protein
MDDKRAALEKAAMLVLMNGSGRITQELWADVLKIIDLIRAEVLEEAAQVVLEEREKDFPDFRTAVAAIRALQEKP